MLKAEFDAILAKYGLEDSERFAIGRNSNGSGAKLNGWFDPTELRRIANAIDEVTNLEDKENG
jgi:hypothetical protein